MFKTNQIHLATSSIPLSFKDKNGVVQERSIPILGLGTPELPSAADGLLVVECPFSFAAGDVSNEHDWHAILTNQPPKRGSTESDSEEEITDAQGKNERTAPPVRREEEREDKPFWVDVVKYDFNDEDTLSFQPGKVNPNAGLSVDEVVFINNRHGALRNQVDGLYYRTKGLLTQKMKGMNRDKDKLKAQGVCVEDLHRWAEKKKQACQWSIDILTKISKFLNKLFYDLTSNWHSFGPGGHFYVNADNLPNNEDIVTMQNLYNDEDEREQVGAAQFKGSQLHGWFMGCYNYNSIVRKVHIRYNKGRKDKVYVWENEKLVFMELYNQGKKIERVEFFSKSCYDVNSQEYVNANDMTRLEMDDIRKSEKPIIKRVIRYLQSDKKEEKGKKPVMMVEFTMLGDLLFVGEGVVEEKEKEYVFTPDKSKGRLFEYKKKSVDREHVRTNYHYLQYREVFENGKPCKFKKLQKGKFIENMGDVKRGRAVMANGYYSLQWVDYEAGKMVDKSISKRTDYFTLYDFLKCSVITRQDGTIVVERYTQFSNKPFKFSLSNGESVKMESFDVVKEDSLKLKL